MGFSWQARTAQEPQLPRGTSGLCEVKLAVLVQSFVRNGHVTACAQGGGGQRHSKFSARFLEPAHHAWRTLWRFATHWPASK